MTREKVIESIEELYKNLDYNVTKLVKARLDKDTKAEGDALFSMEGLMVACQQELSFLHDYLKDKPKPQGLDEAAEEPMQELEKKLTHVQFDETTANWLKYMFKTGAKWMAEQGLTKEAVIGMATEEISINVSQEALDGLDVCPGDNVIVQIRKA